MNLRFSLVFFFLLSSFFLYSQTNEDMSYLPIDTNTNLITYKEVVQENGNPDELYNRAIEWINSFYKNPTGVTRQRDPINHKISGVAQIKIKRTDKEGTNIDMGNVAYTFTFEFKENRYRYELTKFNHKRTSHFPVERWLNTKDPQYNADCPNFLLQIHNYSQDLIQSLKKGMKPKAIIDDSW